MDVSSLRNQLSPVKIYSILVVIIIATFACNLSPVKIPVTGTEEPESYEESTILEEPSVQATPTLNLQIIFSADHTSLQAGDCTQLEWDFQGVEVVQLNGKPVDHSANQEVCPEETTTYTLSGFSGGGLPIAEKVLVISVLGEQQSQSKQPTSTTAKLPAAPAGNSCPGKPVISYFNANPITIDAGQSSVISWDAATNSSPGSIQNITINNGVGGVGSKSSVTIKPTQTTTYTLTADGCGGSVKRTVTVTVNVPQAAPPGGGSAGILTADLAITDLFPESWPDGTIYTRITNNGPGNLLNSEVKIACSASVHPYDGSAVIQDSSSDALFISQTPGQTEAYSTGLATHGTLYWYDVTCNITAPFKDPNSGNNTYSEKFPMP